MSQNHQAFSSATMYMSSILDLLEDVGSQVSLYSSYEKLFFNQASFKKALLDVYLDISAILAKARSTFSQNSWSSLQSSSTF